MGHRTTTKTALIRIASRGNHTEFPCGWKNDVGYGRMMWAFRGNEDAPPAACSGKESVGNFSQIK